MPQALPDRQAAQESYGRLPISFEPNHGQTDGTVDFIARGGGYTMFLMPTEAVMSLSRPAATPSPPSLSPKGGASIGSLLALGSGVGGEGESREPPDVVHMQLVGANPEPQITGRDRLPSIVNYFIGNDPSQWHTDIPTYAKVEYQDVYPGINLVYYGSPQQLEYDFVVAPGADPHAVALNFAGANRLEVDAAGDLVVHAGATELRQHKPVLYQEVNGVRHKVDGAFEVNASLVTFAIGAYEPEIQIGYAVQEDSRLEFRTSSAMQP
jgi:hypothetical protein